jgi:hypothetical protein
MYAHFEGTSQELADLQNDVSAAKTALELRTILKNAEKE